jgi:Fe-S oxidoreductase
LIITVAATGIMVHFLRLLGLPIMTYTVYVIHVGIAAGMLVLMIPFGKLSHLMYRPLAIFLTTLKQKALRESQVSLAAITADIGENFQSCMQCGTCTGVCPYSEISSYSPRKVLRDVALERPNNVSVDEASWTCATCNSCVASCPRDIGLIDMIKSVRSHVVEAGLLPKGFNHVVQSLQKEGNPWQGARANRLDWAKGNELPAYNQEHEYCLFTCCTTDYDTNAAKGSQQAGLALVKLLNHAGVSYGTLGTKESCCGDLADKIGAKDLAAALAKKNTEMFLEAGVKNILTISPHCLDSFKKRYEGLKDATTVHAVELLDELIQKGEIEPVNRVDLRVTYHDPCYLGRHSGIYEAPRRILEAIPGVTLVEMQNNRERSFCCGGGGGGPWKDSAGQETLGEIRVKEALGTGAQVIATACPYCIRMLNEAIAKLGVSSQIKVQDVAELLLQSVDLTETIAKTGKINIGAVKGLSQEGIHV